MTDDMARAVPAPGSREPSPDGLGPSGFDPSREWRNSKTQREILRAKFGGRCAYCGDDLGRTMHADHMEPCIRLHTDPWSRPLPVEERRLLKPERNVVENMMPACAACNLHKGGHSLEQWRRYIARSAEIVRKQTSTFRAGERFGVIVATTAPVVFLFEQWASCACDSDGSGAAGETGTGSTEGDSAGRNGIAQGDRP